MRKLFLFLLPVFLLSLCPTAWGTATKTYTFTSKSWTATESGSAANWTSGKDGYQFSNNGIAVTNNASYNGANGTSPESLSNISRIVATYNTNQSAGAGTIVAQIGENDEVSKSWAYSGSGDGRTANYTVQWDYATPQTGAVKITCNTTTNSIYLVSVAITYTEPITAISLDASASVDAGGTITLVPTLTPSNATETVTWESSNDAVATVSAGVVTGVTQGSCTITAKSPSDASIYATCALTVNAHVDVTSVSLDESSISLVEGATQTLVATILPDNATDKSVIWESDNQYVASVSDAGVVTAIAPGSATITATSNDDGSKSASCAVTVTSAIPFGKVTASRADWSGEYLLVYNDAVAWTGVDATNCNVAVAVSNNVISVVPNTASTLTIATMTGGYSIQINGGTNNGKYISGKGKTGDSYYDILFNASAQSHTLSYVSQMNICCSANSKYMKFNKASNQLRFRYYDYNGTQAAIDLFRKYAFPLSIGGTGWASLYLPYAAIVPTGVTAYYARVRTGNTITLTPIEAGGIIPANTGVVIRGAENTTYRFEKSDSEGADITGLLSGATSNRPVDKVNVDADDAIYVLGYENEQIGFYKYSGANLGAFKSYLIAPDDLGTGAPGVRFIIEDVNNTTNINNVEASNEAVKFIRNGRLFIKKNGITYDALGRMIK